MGFSRRLPLKLKRAAALGAATGVLGAILSLAPPVLELEEAMGLRWLFGRRGPVVPTDRVAVIGISRDSAEALGVPPELDEWPRRLHADLIERLSRLGAAVIVFDIIFQEPRSPEDDGRLAAAIGKAGNVILAERVVTEPISWAGGDVWVDKRILPIPPFKEAALASAPFTLPVVPVTTSQFWTFGRGAGDIGTLPVVALQAFALSGYEPLLAALSSARPALRGRLPGTREEVLATRSLENVVRDLRGAFREHPELARRVLAGVGETEASERRLLEALVAVYAGAEHRYLNYYGPAKTIRTIPYHHVIGPMAKPDEELALRGKVVFVGYSESRQSEQQDDFISVFSLRSGQNLSGVEIAATAFANLLEQSSIRPLPPAAHVGVVLVVGFLYGAALAWLPTVGMLVLAVAGAGLYSAFASWQFASSGLWLPLVVPVLMQTPVGLLAAVLASHRSLRLQRERIRRVLGYYLPTTAVERLVEQSVEAGSDRQLLYGTCLFTDVEQYTSVSERMDPARLGELLNAYYEVLVEAVRRHGGEVSDMAGDSMLAIWAGVRPDAADRSRACRAALAIAAEVEAFNRARGADAMPTRIGLASGQLLLANIGGADRFEYRAVGDIVNTAARLQSLNRVLGTRVLVSERTLEDVTGLTTRNVGRFLLRGKTEPVVVHEVLGADAPPAPERAALVEIFAAALDRFQAGDWAAAEARFEQIAARDPGDGPARYYLGLARRYRTDPPSAWDGTVEVGVK
ncbi:MAG TPA: adenylate/guanylate cyclase domain-containing protein [Gammaproteobacteria bacterium]